MKRQTQNIRILYILLLLCAILAGRPDGGRAESNAPGADASRPTLRILNWRNYIDLDDSLPKDLPIAKRSPTLLEFAEKFSCDIEYHEFEDFEDISAKFSSLPGFHDIMLLSCTHTTGLIATGWLLPVSEEQVPNLSYIDAALRSTPPDPEGRYLIPYMNDYLALIVRKDKIKESSISWSRFFDPPPSWRGHMALLDYGPDIFVAALIANGAKDYANPRSTVVQAAQKSIQHLADRFEIKLTDVPEEDILEDEDLWITPIYAVDAAQILHERDDLVCILPTDGTDYYHDFMVIHRESHQPELAMAFMNYILEPEVMGRIAAYMDATAPSAAARAVRAELDDVNKIPYAMDANGNLLPNIQARYTFNPLYELLWIQTTQSIRDQEEDGEDDDEED